MVAARRPVGIFTPRAKTARYSAAPGIPLRDTQACAQDFFFSDWPVVLADIV